MNQISEAMPRESYQVPVTCPKEKDGYLRHLKRTATEAGQRF